MTTPTIVLPASRVTLLSFHAGLMKRDGKQVVPDARKGVLEVWRSSHDFLVHVSWYEREGSVAPPPLEIDLVVFPGEAEWRRVGAAGGRVAELRFPATTPPERHFFWFQDASDAQDGARSETMGKLLQSGAAAVGDAGPAPAGAVSAPAATAAPMEGVVQPQPTLPAASLASAASSSSSAAAAAATAAAPSPSSSSSSSGPAAAGVRAPLFAADALQNALASLGVPTKPQQRVSLQSVLRADDVQRVLPARPGAVDALRPLLPECDQAAVTSVAAVAEQMRSPFVQQAMDQLEAAIQENPHMVMAAFGLDPSRLTPYSGLAEFLEELHRQLAPRRDK